MADEGKKISFGFFKSIKKPALKNTPPQEEKKVDYIECLDEKSIKVIGEEEKKDEPLVIPLLGSRTWHDRIVNKVDADIFEPKTIKDTVESVSIKEEQKPDLTNGNATPQNKEPSEKVDSENKSATLEEQAAKEIIEELKSESKQERETKLLTLPLAESQSLRGEEQSTLDDYEKIPVDAFGFAMLRGMGWQPGKGIGKNEKIVSAVIPELRPKGMGLGADKVQLQKQKTDSKKQDEELKIEKGTFVKIIAGKQSDNYGQIEGFDDDAGRLMVKLALGGNIISLNEFVVQPVTKSEYLKNAKVLNAKKYEEYKDKESKDLKNKGATRKRTSSDYSESSDSDDENITEKKRRKLDRNKSDKTHDKRSKNRKKHTDSDSDEKSDYGKRARKRSTSSSSDTYKSKKSKKSKKHRRQDSSPERSNKKHKKKDKQREKVKDKRSRDFESTDRKKHKKRGRSRSRSIDRR